MNTLIAKTLNLQILPQNDLFHFPPPLAKKIPHHIHPFPGRIPCTAKTLTFAASACGGWDDPGFIGESNQLNNSLDKKYVFVYLLGFVCALAISRVKVSSIIAIPGCVLVFALGFSMGFIKMSFDGSWRLPQHQIFVEKLVDFLNGFDVEIGNLKKGVRKGIEYNQITVEDLQCFDKILDSINFSARKVVQGCIESVSAEGLEMERNTSQKRKKEPPNYGFNFSQIAMPLFQTKSGSKSSKTYAENEVIDTEMNILASAAKERHSNSLFDMNVDATSRHTLDDEAIRQDKAGGTFGKGSKMNVVSDENASFSEMDSNTVREEYSYQTSRVRFMRNQEVSHRMRHPSEIESWASSQGLVDSMDFNVNMERTKTEASFLREQKVDNLEGISSNFGGKVNDEETYRHSSREEIRNHEKEPSMASHKASNECQFGFSPSSVDLQFNEYLTEANFLVKEAKDCLRQGNDRDAEDAFYKSAILLSKAIDIRPMSLLAVGQLGNTYLLHGELKLRISRDLRALLTDTASVNKRTNIPDGLDDTVPREDKITSYLVNVCEECEELLVKAGRQYRLALSMDGNDARALYNWGLALSFRAQLIADIGPGAACDADKVFLAAIDKFDAMMSRGNVYAPDALFRWATALQHRSRLRPRSSREKVKLLQQAQRLYEDALHMDSDNLQVKEALSSCSSELKYWYR